MAYAPPRRIVVVGAGDSGILAAQRLLQAGPADLLVTLVERSPEAAATLLERASSLAAHKLRPGARPGRLHVLSAEARAVTLTQRGLVIELSDGTSCGGNVAVLATGRDPTMSEDDVFTIPCDVETKIPGTAAVIGIGTNFAVISSMARMIARGHTGRLHAVSPHGALPFDEPDCALMTMDRADVPFGTGIVYLMRWFRRSVAWAAARGIDWRSVVDGFQPHAAEVWHHLAQADRERFLRHLGGLWEAHRDRLDKGPAEVIARAIATGQLTVTRGRVVSVTPLTRGARVEIAARGGSRRVTLEVDKVIERRGPHQERLGMRNPIVASLVAQGLARPDPVALGLEVTDRGALIGRNGVASERLYAVGPASRAAIWEIMGPRTLHEQGEALVRTIVNDEASPLAGLAALNRR